MFSSLYVSEKGPYRSSAISSAWDEMLSSSHLVDIDSNSCDDETYKAKVAEVNSSLDNCELEEINDGPLREVAGIADDIERRPCASPSAKLLENIG